MSDNRIEFPPIADILSDITLFQATLLTSFNSATLSTGNAGRLTIEAGTLSMQGGALITTATLGDARGGDIRIGVDNLNISGYTQQPNVIVRTGISAATLGTEDAGNVTINAQRVSLSDGNIIDSSSFGTGNAGDVAITASEKIIVQGRSAVLARDGSEFVIVGRGGRPMSPARYSDRAWNNILPDFGDIPEQLPEKLPERRTTSDGYLSDRHRPLLDLRQEASEIAIAANGTVELVAATPLPPYSVPVTCSSMSRTQR
ncbi:MAG: hypothetical protein AAGD25_27710 [Cyanobacteria bacterium P01_F01_bin.150]